MPILKARLTDVLNELRDLGVLEEQKDQVDETGAQVGLRVSALGQRLLDVYRLGAREGGPDQHEALENLLMPGLVRRF